MDRPLINTVSEAIEFLRQIDIEVIGIWHGWILRGINPDNDFELTLDTNAELIEHARYERNQCVQLCERLGLERLEHLPIFHSHSSAAQQRPTDQVSKDTKAPQMEKTRKEVQP